MFKDNERITKHIRNVAADRELQKPNAEIACLIREKFTDKDIGEMGLIWIVAMHEPIKDYDGDPLLLYAYRLGDGRWLDAYYSNPGNGWFRGFGFAFAVSQVSAQ
ncbi:MAG: hypothetical protein ACKOW9_01045 [Candidatus Paceibacterota bacterium]